MSVRLEHTREDVDEVRDALEFMRDCGDRPGMYDEAKAALAALDRLVARNQQLQEALTDGVRVASQYLDTDRGDLDGWIDAARAALASVRATQEGEV